MSPEAFVLHAKINSLANTLDAAFTKLERSPKAHAAWRLSRHRAGNGSGFLFASPQALAHFYTMHIELRETLLIFKEMEPQHWCSCLEGALASLESQIGTS